jgi:hypothetical protein
MDARASQIILDEDELDDSISMKETPKSSHLSTASGYTLNTLSLRSNIDSKYRVELKKMEKDKKEQFEVI